MNTPQPYKGTGVYATEEERVEIMNTVELFRNTPAIAFTTQHALGGGAAEDARQHVMQTIHRIALSHGLPEIVGYYGFDPATKEFNKAL